MPFNEYPFIRYTLFFILGVVLYPFIGLGGHSYWFGGCVALFVIYSIFLFRDITWKGEYFKWLLPPLAYGILVLAGITFSILKDVRNDASHLLFQGEIDGYLAEVREMDQPKARSVANRVRVIAVKKATSFTPANGDLLLYHKGLDTLQPGEVYFFSGQPDRLQAPENPSEFNYALFMGRQQIYHRHFVRERPVFLGNSTGWNLSAAVARFRHYLENTIDSYVTLPRSQQIAKALLLGQKASLENEVSEAYVTAGAMHVLAVSGLHVGIIYGFFFLFWKPQKLAVRKRIPLLLLVIGIIWSYALITGMSPSVLRAATMFSLMALAQMQSKSPSIFNPLALSAMILLLYDPFIVFSVGFQLSYVALLGILLFQPLIVSWWTPENRLLDYIWQISSVGIAAQLATFPLSVHYFHVFPTYFLLANIVAIPGAFAIMAFGIPFLLLSPFEPVAEILGLGLNQLITTVNTLIFSVQFLPISRIENLRFSGMEMLLVWGGICCLFVLIVQRKKRFAYLAVLPALALVAIRWWDFYETMKIDELVMYKFDKGKAVDYFYKGQLYSLDDGISDTDLSYKVSPYRVQKGMTTPMRLAWTYAEEDPLVFLPDGQLVRLPMSPQSPKHHMHYFHAGEWKQPELPYDAIPEHYALRYLAK